MTGTVEEFFGVSLSQILLLSITINGTLGLFGSFHANLVPWAALIFSQMKSNCYESVQSRYLL
ncbi:unnamed protein product [Acidithrix sp. C25]|nr:unnamed protein product [Acidithrix sp. C25]